MNSVGREFGKRICVEIKVLRKDVGIHKIWKTVN